MNKSEVRGIAFDMYGTLVDTGAVKTACEDSVPDPTSFNAFWRSKQLEYTFLRSLMQRYKDFWSVTEEALEFTLQYFALEMTSDQRKRLMNAWLDPVPYPEVPARLSQLKKQYPLAVLSNGSPEMLEIGLERTDLRQYFRWVISADQVEAFKPSPEVYGLLPAHFGISKDNILFVSSNSFDVLGAKSFGFQVCWVNRTGKPLDTPGHRPDLIVENFHGLARLA